MKNQIQKYSGNVIRFDLFLRNVSVIKIIKSTLYIKTGFAEKDFHAVDFEN